MESALDVLIRFGKRIDKSAAQVLLRVDTTTLEDLFSGQDSVSTSDDEDSIRNQFFYDMYIALAGGKEQFLALLDKAYNEMLGEDDDGENQSLLIGILLHWGNNLDERVSAIAHILRDADDETIQTYLEFLCTEKGYASDDEDDEYDDDHEEHPDDSTPKTAVVQKWLSAIMAKRQQTKTT